MSCIPTRHDATVLAGGKAKAGERTSAAERAPISSVTNSRRQPCSQQQPETRADEHSYDVDRCADIGKHR
jgi:hypothetical protein